MNSDSKDNGEAIDNALYDLLDSVVEYQELRKACGGQLRDAFFNLTLARRSAGYNRISPDLCSGKAKAIATIEPAGVQIHRRAVENEKDPLMWFGMLVPPQLRKAQQEFVGSLNQLVKLAQLQRQIEHKRRNVQTQLKT